MASQNPQHVDASVDFRVKSFMFFYMNPVDMPSWVMCWYDVIKNAQFGTEKLHCLSAVLDGGNVH